MLREEAIMMLKEIRHYLTAGNPVWDVDEIAEACDMAIEALTHDIRTETHGVCSDLIRRADAIDALGEEPEVWNETEDEWAYRDAWVEHISAIKSLPSADRPKNMIHIDEVYRLIAGHSNYHGDSILSAFTCLVEGKDVKPIAPLDESAEPKTGWIPVSEELPSEGQVVLAIGDKGTWDVGKFRGTAEWTDDERMWWWKNNSVKRVEYWMPKDAIQLPNREDGE